jgi:hypothetical protein
MLEFNRKKRITEALADIEAAASLSDYEAVDVLWVALLKMANTMHGSNEHKRMMSLVQAIPDDQIKTCLVSRGVQRLLDLDPPLETVLSDPHERLDPEATASAVRAIRTCHETSPRDAMLSLGEILKRIRNKRVHGFKTRNGSRDAEILGAARAILEDLCRASAEALSGG